MLAIFSVGLSKEYTKFRINPDSFLEINWIIFPMLKVSFILSHNVSGLHAVRNSHHKCSYEAQMFGLAQLFL